MVRIEKIRADITRDKKVIDIQVSTTNNLPNLNENVNGIIIQAGSSAEIVQSGLVATLDDDGKWYAGGSEV